MKRVLLAIIISLIFSDINANSEASKSVQWQRIDLESKLRERISEFLSLIVDKNKYFVEVQISASTPNLTVPNFEMPKNEKNKVIQGVKFTDEKNDKSRDNAEYILFDKIGILSPLFESESAQESNDKELQVKFYQYKEKLERELISKNDLFGLISSVDITIAFDKKLEDTKVEEIKKLVDRIVPKFGETKASIEVFKMDFFEEVKEENEAVVKKEEEVAKEKSLEELIKENIPYLTGPIGTILATIFVCLSAFILFFSPKKTSKTFS